MVDPTSAGDVHAIPVLRDLQTDELWRGMGEVALASYNTMSSGPPDYSILFYPLPPRRAFRMGLFLVCDPGAPPDCSVQFLGSDLGSTASTWGSAVTWTESQHICLWRDEILTPTDDSGVLTEDLASSTEWQVGADGWSGSEIPSTSCDAFFED